MKSARTFLLFLLLNAAWLAAGSYFLARHFAKADGESPVRYVTNYVPVATSTPLTPIIVTNTIAATNEFRWAQLESEDYRAYITRLRAIGCPEQTIRDIIIADIDKLLAPRMQAANPRTKDVKYWQPLEQELWEGTEQRAAWQQQRTLDFEKREVIRELLGIDLVGERLRVQGQDDYHGQRLGFLPEEKRARVRTVLDQFADQERALLEQQVEEGEATVSSAELARVRQQKEAALAPLFTPEERKQYDLWFSDTAARVRESTLGMKASEGEFLKLYELQRTVEARNDGTLPPAGSAEWQQYQQQARETLGEGRYAEWQRAQDSDYRELARLTARFKLPASVAADLYQFKQPIAQEQARIESDPNITTQQRNAAYQAISEETQRTYKEALGEKAFRQYLKRTTNPWMRSSGR